MCVCLCTFFNAHILLYNDSHQSLKVTSMLSSALVRGSPNTNSLIVVNGLISLRLRPNLNSDSHYGRSLNFISTLYCKRHLMSLPIDAKEKRDWYSCIDTQTALLILQCWYAVSARFTARRINEIHSQTIFRSVVFPTPRAIQCHLKCWPKRHLVWER